MKSAFQNILAFKKGNGTIIVFSVLLLFIALFFRESLYGIFGEQNYLTIHLIMEFFIITIAFTIAIQSWMVFPHILSSYRLWIGALFFSVGIIEVAHAITYKGMPFFISESSAYKATWFFMAARLTEVIVMLAIVTSKDRLVSSRQRYVAYSIAFLYSAVWLVAVYYPKPLLPDLVMEGIGTTTLKNNLQFVGIGIELIIIYVVASRFQSKQVFNYMLITASVYLIIADYYFTTYKSVYDINNFIGHLFQLAGFYFLQRAVYHTSVEEPFEKKIETEILLKQSEEFLQSITSNMGEGLIVMNDNGELTYMNFEAEQLLGWSKEDLLGKNIHDYIHRHKDGSHFPKENCPSLKASKEGEVYRVNEDYFIRKNGKIFPVSYVVTPFANKGQASGAIIVFRDITQMKKDEELIHYLAFYDELTKLPNIRCLKEKWEEIVEGLPNQKAAILILDINRFKNINEALGHSFGDLILQEAAKRLNEQLFPNMFLYRMTGDEFVLILPTEEETEILTKFEAIQLGFKEPLRAQQLLLNVTFRCGVALYPQHGSEIEGLLQHANIALMEAQNQNKSIQLYEPFMDGKALDNLVFENDLYNAISRNELYVVYQPQVELGSGKIIGVEALIRWHHPAHGWISPGKFISIAEETGLIIPIGEWILRTACRQMKQWHNEGLPPLRVAVNLSIRQFYQQNLSDTVQEILQETGLLPQYLELEITESMMMNIDHTKKTLDALKHLGIEISIDDFGTGYSSLAYLKHLPVDRLKIDQSFVRDIVNKDSDMTIISTIISMARFLNLEVIAEGVETVIQKEMLQNEQCMQIQGYLISKPLPPDELLKKFDSLQETARVIVTGV
ncbi:MAG TPA: EAL domain-containing protein [Bacillus bacterium]|nr:EAL domain-containing protein [Bacillus sp. (in: firmicutes)]